MSKVKHTPGPWTNHGRIQQPGLPHSSVAAKTLLARVYSEAFGDDAQETANANLIAAAPDLLDALRIARETIKTERDVLFDCHVNPASGKVHDAHGRAGLAEFDEVLAQIDAAVSKATGGQ
jgi:hypothetical protein